MKEYLDYLDNAAAAYQQEARALRASCREDEANFARIRVNVCGICKTVYEALQRATPPPQFERVYLAKLAELERTWQAAYDRAAANYEAEKVIVEESKLKTLQKIKVQYLEQRRKSYAGSAGNQAL